MARMAKKKNAATRTSFTNSRFKVSRLLNPYTNRNEKMTICGFMEVTVPGQEFFFFCM